jgi:hypothetical protein
MLKLRADFEIQQGLNCIKLQVWSQLEVKLNEIKNWRTKLNFLNKSLIQGKTASF